MARRKQRFSSSNKNSKLAMARNEAKRKAEGKENYKQILDCIINAMSVQQVVSVEKRFGL